MCTYTHQVGVIWVALTERVRCLPDMGLSIVKHVLCKGKISSKRATGLHILLYGSAYVFVLLCIQHWGRVYKLNIHKKCLSWPSYHQDWSEYKQILGHSRNKTIIIGKQELGAQADCYSTRERTKHTLTKVKAVKVIIPSTAGTVR